MTEKRKLFYGEISKGFILKVTIDTLCGPLQRGIFVIDKDGIRLRQTDLGNTVLYDINLPRKNIRGYRCTKPLVISVNLKHVQNLLRNVKKKDSLALSICGEKLSITIRPEGAKKNTRFETNSVVYQEEKDYVIDGLPDGGYGYPMVIEAVDFQKIKRLTSIGKIISVTIQKDNYLSFECDAGVVYDSQLGFGELRTADDEGDEEEGEKKVEMCKKCKELEENCYCECETCGEYLCDCYCECETCGEYLRCCKCSTGGYDEMNDEEVPGLFESQYYSHIITKLVKLPGLCNQMQFYAPTIQGFPLRIEVNAGQGGFTLGTIQVFIKDVQRIAFEESIKNAEDNVVSTKTTKSKGKMKK